MHFGRNINVMATIKYKVSGLTCGGCVNRVKNTLNDYATDVEVTLIPPHATLTSATVDIHQLNAALKQVGEYQLSVIAVETPNDTSTQEKSWFATYKPLLLVFAFILLTTLAVESTHGSFVLSRWMPHFMAGFFIVFSFFKLLDLSGFANSYAMYDLLAKKWLPYGFIYPFIELGLGFAYLTQWQPTITNWLTLIIMSFSTVGVLFAVSKKQTIQCACLGTGFNLPMSTVTIIEDLLMVAMAAVMLIT